MIDDAPRSKPILHPYERRWLVVALKFFLLISVGVVADFLVASACRRLFSGQTAGYVANGLGVFVGIFVSNILRLYVDRRR